MSLTARQKSLVQTSWSQVEPIAETAATLFYAKLFELDPALKPLFTSDPKEQGKKLMTMIAFSVRGLDNLSALVPAIQNMGKRHIGYGVQDAHYTTVGTALIWTLGQGLGPAFTDEVKEAWTAVYTILADTMKAGAAA
jgi:hemoglobin-like flavoprotein